MDGQVHIYSGDGKGKTTAAVGLSVRAHGQGLRVWFVQFLKSGNSHELKPLEALGIKVITGMPINKFSFQMTEDEKREVRRAHDERLAEVRAAAEAGAMDLLVLDEAIGAASGAHLLDEEALLRFIKEKPKALELVLTGRDPSPELCEATDYLSEIVMRKHPYETKRLPARPGIEF